MMQLAQKSDGNHYFVEQTTDLARQFSYEFDDVLSVVAQEVTVRITCGDGVRPIRVLGREADITGQTVTTYLNQVYGKQEKYVLLELETPAGTDGMSRNVADVSVNFVNMGTKTAEKITRSAMARFTRNPNLVESSTNAPVMASAVEQIGVEKNKLAVSLRDQGKIEEARKVLLENERYLSTNAAGLKVPELADYARSQAADAANLDPETWERQRKDMLMQQNTVVGQQGGRGVNRK
jgi:Ca-activated chloride channel family protein